MAGDGRNLDQTTVALISGGKTSRLLKSGDIIGDSYRLKGLIGRGGMGYVFRAEHLIIGKDYALKILAPDQINEVTWNRFQSEGKAIAHLDHPNIVKIYNMGVDRGDCPYYVMDLLDGIALSDCIQDNLHLSLDEVVDMFIQLASGFGYAHSRGIIHRDVKPSNVMLIDSGGQYPNAKIFDFGIAKLAGGSDLHHQSLTVTGEIFGSPYYMSPEQCLGTEIDHRADIYSLGCTLFEALCGKPPFVGESALQTVMMHQNEPSPTLESVSGRYSSDEMEALLAKMLMKRPADRYQSMEQVLHDLDRIRQRKAVGKIVDTGFRSSVDSQLEDLGSRYEEKHKGTARHNKILIAFASMILCFAVVVCGRIFVLAIRPGAKTPEATPTSGLLSVSSLDASLKRADSDGARAAKALSAIKPITSTIDKKNGTRVFHCPDMHIGILGWWLGKKNCAGIDFDGADDGRVDAYREAQVPANQPIFLTVDLTRNRDTWRMPGILAKFGPNDLIGLRLTAPIAIYDVSTEVEQNAETALVNALTKAISGWTNCQIFEFKSVPAPDQALIELDQHKALRQFVASDANLNAKVLAKRRFLHHLTALELRAEPDCDLILCALKGSSSIASIALGHTTIAPETLMVLATCPNLRILWLNQCPVDARSIEAISSISTLRRLKITEAGLLPEQIKVLAKLRYIDRIELTIC